MLSIDRLQISLPAGFETRATGITRLIGDELATLPIRGDLHVEHLTLPAIEVSSWSSDRRVARSVAAAVSSSLNRSSRGELL